METTIVSEGIRVIPVVQSGIDWQFYAIGVIFSITIGLLYYGLAKNYKHMKAKENKAFKQV